MYLCMHACMYDVCMMCAFICVCVHIFACVRARVCLCMPAHACKFTFVKQNDVCVLWLPATTLGNLHGQRHSR